VHLLAMLAVALAVGFGLSYYALNDGRLFGALQIGPWTAWPRAGTSSPDPYTRAFLARTGSLQLGFDEGIEFVATTDSSGAILETNCNYVLSGTMPTAALWTLVPAAADGSVLGSADRRAGLVSSQLVRDADGGATVHIGEALRPGNWLEIAGNGPFQLVLTLYGTDMLSPGAVPADLLNIARDGCT
jgi:hypothetical protein